MKDLNIVLKIENEKSRKWVGKSYLTTNMKSIREKNQKPK